MPRLAAGAELRELALPAIVAQAGAFNPTVQFFEAQQERAWGYIAANRRWRLPPMLRERIDEVRRHSRPALTTGLRKSRLLLRSGPCRKTFEQVDWAAPFSGRRGAKGWHRRQYPLN